MHSYCAVTNSRIRPFQIQRTACPFATFTINSIIACPLITHFTSFFPPSFFQYHRLRCHLQCINILSPLSPCGYNPFQTTHILAVHLFNYVLNKSLNARILETHSGLIPLILIHQINYFIFPYLKQNHKYYQ